MCSKIDSCVFVTTLRGCQMGILLQNCGDPQFRPALCFNDTNVVAEITARVTLVMHHPALLGYYICDGKTCPTYCQIVMAVCCSVNGCVARQTAATPMWARPSKHRRTTLSSLSIRIMLQSGHATARRHGRSSTCPRARRGMRGRHALR